MFGFILNLKWCFLCKLKKKNEKYCTVEENALKKKLESHRISKHFLAIGYCQVGFYGNHHGEPVALA